MRQILVIHPDDPTTDFLKDIYRDIDCDVINMRVTDQTLIREMKLHDQIMIMGHGAPFGLLGFGGVFVNSSHVQFLRGKPNNIYIWCNANKFVEQYELQGFYSGMFISEVEEAEMYDIKIDQKDIDYSNKLFANIVNEQINNTSNILCEAVKNNYNLETNPVIQFNNERLWSR